LGELALSNNSDRDLALGIDVQPEGATIMVGGGF
jgi:hypothetical protein